MPMCCEKMLLDYASPLVHTSQLKQAIEALEQGRALLWSEMRYLRPSIDRLCGANGPLAEKLIATDNQGLEEPTMSSL